MRVRLASLGCRLNASEIETLTRRLEAAGHTVVAKDEAADLCIFNSCAVTAEAARKSRSALRRLRRTNPGARLVVTGCLAELQPDEIRRLGADLSVGNQDKEELPEILHRIGLLDGDAPGSPILPSPPGVTVHTRAFVKIQDGCDNACSYCIVTIARGPARSRSPDDVVRHIHQLRSAGYNEVVLTGVHLGSYGHDQGQHNGLARLIVRILEESDLPRLRLSSIEPWDLTTELLGLFGRQRLMPHLHLPLQSGCDDTLARMARRITAARYASLVAEARQQVPELSISTDIMVGFPGESDADHAASVAFVERIAFSRLHVFRFSPRPGTPAATMDDQVSGPVAQQRSRQMLRLGADMERSYNRRWVGRRLPVLWETCDVDGAMVRLSGLTPHYVRVRALAAGTTEDLSNLITETELTGLANNGLIGRLIAAASHSLPLITNSS